MIKRELRVIFLQSLSRLRRQLPLHKGAFKFGYLPVPCMGFHTNACAFALNDEVTVKLFVIILKLNEQFTFYTVVQNKNGIRPTFRGEYLFREISQP